MPGGGSDQAGQEPRAEGGHAPGPGDGGRGRDQGAPCQPGGRGDPQVHHHRGHGQPRLRHLVLQQQGAELTLIILRIIKVVWISFDIYPN